MMVAMACLQVFIVRFFFQVCHITIKQQFEWELMSYRAQERVTYERCRKRMLQGVKRAKRGYLVMSWTMMHEVLQ